MDNASKLRSSYYKWVKSGISFDNLQNGYVSINTPFIDNNYDSISLYAKLMDDSTVHLSDFGFTLYNLDTSGVNISKNYKVRWYIFNNILKTFGVNYDDDSDSLFINTDVTNFPTAKIRLMQAILHVQDISYLDRHNIKSSFNDIVQKSLDIRDVFYTKSLEIANNNGISIHFDFSISAHRRNHRNIEKLVRTVSRPNDINQAKIFNYDVKFIYPVRPARFILLINDAHKKNVKNSMKNAALLGLKRNIAQTYKYSDIKKNNKILSNTY